MITRKSVATIGVVLLNAIVTSSAYDALQRSTELQYWDSSRADNGYNFFGVGGTTYLLDMQGRVVHTWPVGNNPHLLSNGNVLDTNTNDPSGFTGFKEVTWDGATAWSYLETRSTYHPHHDFTRIFNPKLNAYTTLYIANKDLTYAELVAAGADPAKAPTTGAQMDAIVEVDTTGAIVWEWCFSDHLVQDYDATKSNYVATGKTIADYPNRLNINLAGHNLKADWLHCNSLDYNQALDQIVVNSVQGEFYVIDHGNTFIAGNPSASTALAATSTGDFLYRFGDPARYDQGSKPSILEDWTLSTTGNKQLGGAHHITWIADGLTGAGHFLIFNNAEYLSEHTSQSYVMEINPYLDADGNNTGHYVNPPDAGYNTLISPAVTDKTPKLISKQVVWNYYSKSNLTLYSNIGCSAQRLPNGNTLVCADTYGYVMEVTPAGETVWDYIEPVTTSGIALVLGDRLPMVNSIFRAFRYKADDPALAGRTLTPGATIAGRTTVANPYAGTSNYQALQRPTETQYWDATNAYNGYTFFAAQGTSYLIDMQGRVAHTWATGTDSRLLESGNVLDWATNTGGQTGLKELDWNGATVWEHYETRTTYHPHGDFKRIYDPKLGAYATLYLANKDVTATQCIAAGCDPADAPYDGAQVDTIVEVDMSGNIVWEWSFWDHAIQNVDATKANYVTTIANYPGKINLNLPGRPLRNNWLDCNSLDYNQSLDQIIVNCRQGEFYVIDHGNTFLPGNPTGSITLAATTAGDFLYRFGDPARYSQGNPPSVGTNWETATNGNKQIGGSCNVQWIASGLSGAGHLLVFNNNQYLYQRTPQSYVFEINPFLNSSGVDTGAYVNPPAAGYNTWNFDKDTMKANQSLSKQVVWKYGSVSNLTMFSHFGSSAQRLPNGNTLICATTEGYLVEVNTSGNVVWEYINPVTDAGIATAIGDRLPMTNAVPRAARYAAGFAGFLGHTLTPGNTIAGNGLPVIAGTTRTPTAPSATDEVWITSTVTDDSAVASVALTYSSGSGTPTTTTPFTETMTTAAVKPWTGTGSVNAWTVTGDYFEQRIQANYGTGNACGMEYKGLTTNNALASAMVATTNSINATGASGYVEFWLQTLTLDGTDGWTFQVDSGSGYVTRLSELTGSSHAWQKYHYDLTSGELVGALKMRFQFTGGGTADLDDRIDLDQINVTVTSGGASTSTVTMFDDGNHSDGAAGDHRYGARIPAAATGTAVSYYLTATDDGGFSTTDPVTAPTDIFTYTVQNNSVAPTVVTPASASPIPVTGTTSNLAVLGADGDTGEASLSYTWAATTVPSGASSPVFSANGTNAAKSSTATFSKAGSYTLQVTIADPGGLSVSSQIAVTVSSTPTTIVVIPASASLSPSATQQFAATAYDQFGIALATQPPFTWSTTVGAISASGLLTAPSTPGSGSVTASSGGLSGTASVVVTSLSQSYTMTALPDTGQVTSYSTIHGEDSDYTINPPTYQDNGDGTITDKVTGLMWQKTDGGEMTREQAIAYADNLSLAGYTDWRLAFGKELFSIMNEGAINPAINTTFFPASSADYWWSADVAVDDSTKAWATNAGGGIGPHPKSETISAGGTKRFHVRCVREPIASGITHLYGNLTSNGNGTVTDNHTGLVWQQGETAAMTWEQALVYAENLTLNGASDWRLPNIKELQSVSDSNFRNPSLDKAAFPGASATRYWSSTTLFGSVDMAWYLETDYGLTSYDTKTALWHVRCVRGGNPTSQSAPALSVIPSGSFVMGDHFNYTDPGHPSDEKPLHTVAIDGFCMGTYDITNRQYCDYLNSALAQGLIEVRQGLVYAVGGSIIYCETRSSTLYAVSYSGIEWNGSAFSVLAGRDNHPMVGVRWEGAAAYCNWLSAVQGYQPCYDLTTWVCTFTKNGYRLPTEAEWEYAANGGRSTYAMFPWGDYPNTDGTWSNWQGSGDPYEAGDYPWTTPVGFYNGQLHLKSEFNWPGIQNSYQTSNAANGYGLYDMAGNVWQWTNDWYDNDYYSVSPAANPTGPSTGDPMPDGNPYRVLRGGNWYNGAEFLGHSRIANRDPGYYRGPDDPNHPFYHVGFRVALKTSSLVQPGATVSPVVTDGGFFEGPAADSDGNVFFSDIKANTIYRLTPARTLSVFRSNSGGSNGLAIDPYGNLIACEGTTGRIVSITPEGGVRILASTYSGTRFNEPNDLWIDPWGGIYFTDPVFFGTQVQNGQHVYYISPDRRTVTRVISDMLRPNGLVGSADGTTLYVSDYGSGATYRYMINADGTLTGKTLFVAVGSDGMEIDSDGNVYLTTDDVQVYNTSGTRIQTINVPDRPTNLCFAGTDRRTLFITTETTLYSIPVRTQGLPVAIANSPPAISGTTRMPTVVRSSDLGWITARITDDSGVAGAQLVYSTGSGSATPTTSFTETMTSTAVKPWTGAGAVNAWTVTGNFFEQRTQANQGAGNACGMEFKGAATLNALTGAMITTTNAINAAGPSGYVEFWVQSLTLDGTDGWTFQLDSGSGFVTRLSELSGSSHAWQKYHYDLAAGELVGTLKMRFQFTGGGVADDDRIDLDQITVTVVSGGSGSTTVAMLDDGNHVDGLAGDGIYGASIPAMPAGTTVNYHLAATDDAGLSTMVPSNAPASTLSYTVTDTSTDQTVGTFFNSANAFDGYTLIAPMHHTKTYLINNAGEVVHRWSSAYEPGRSAFLLENGRMMRACMIMSGGPSTGGGEGGRIEEYDWDGNMTWAFDYYSSNYIAHHDFKVLPNGNVLVLVAEKKTLAEVTAAGFNPALLDAEITTKGYMLPDYIIEVAPTRPYGGTVVWEWHMWDHMIQDFDAAKNNYGVVANHPELIDVNGTGMKIPQFWNHVNGIDYNPQLDQVMLSVRGNSELFVVDHQLSTSQAAGHTAGRYGKGGDILYRWGNPAQYDRGTNANQQFYQQHHTHWIPAGLPGAGNMLIFNNGIGRGYSSINQLVPPVDAAGAYTLASGSAFGPTTPVWTYTSTPTTNFYSAEISGCQRLPNGNTLICEGVKGNLFEVTSTGQTVWRYLCPVTDIGPLTQGSPPAEDSVRPGQYMNAVFRVYRYGTDFAGLAGRDLTPQGTIELPVDQTFRAAGITVSRTAGSSAVAVSWVSLPDKLYTIQYSPSLATGSWTNVSTFQSIGSRSTFVDTNPARSGQSRGFYRVALQP